MKEKTKPLYGNLKGMKLSAPDGPTIRDHGISSHYHEILSELGDAMNRNLDSYKISIEVSRGSSVQRAYNYIHGDEYRTKLSSLIEMLKSEFDFDPSTASAGFSVTQNQSTNVQVEITLQLQELLLTRISEYEEGTPERTFLEKVKGSVSQLKNINDILRTVMKEGASLGMNAAKIMEVLGL